VMIPVIGPAVTEKADDLFCRFYREWSHGLLLSSSRCRCARLKLRGLLETSRFKNIPFWNYTWRLFMVKQWALFSSLA